MTDAKTLGQALDALLEPEKFKDFKIIEYT